MKSEDIKEAFKILSLWGCKFEDTVFMTYIVKKKNYEIRRFKEYKDLSVKYK